MIAAMASTQNAGVNAVPDYAKLPQEQAALTQLAAQRGQAAELNRIKAALAPSRNAALNAAAYAGVRASDASAANSAASAARTRLLTPLEMKDQEATTKLKLTAGQKSVVNEAMNKLNVAYKVLQNNGMVNKKTGAIKPPTSKTSAYGRQIFEQYGAMESQLKQVLNVQQATPQPSGGGNLPSVRDWLKQQGR
jgi:hypothetical protein